MSDTTIISTISLYDDRNTKKMNNNRSCCARYWCQIVSSFLSLIILISSLMLVYVLNKHAERDRKRQYMKDKFKREHGVANKVLDMITKNGIIYKWIKAHKGPISTTFKELFTDIAETLFGE